MWFVVIIVSFFWLIGVLYLLFGLYYKITRKEVFVPFVPADTKGVDSMCEAINLKGDERVIDIGSGWGTILFYLVDKYPKLSLVGIELHPVLHFFAVLRRFFFHRNSDIELIKGDAANIQYDGFDVIFLFMLAPFMNKVLVPKFEKELKKGTKVVSYVFRMKSSMFKESRIILPAHGWRSAVYLYEKIA